MKKISERQRQLVTDLIAEQDLKISEYALEKDYIVTDALQALFKIEDPQFDFIFCGGTCFSKAYGLLDRISEDVDIKVILKPGLNPSGSRLRESLSQLKPKIISALVSAGFNERDINKHAQDENKCLTFDANYDTHFIKADDMRSNMKLELNFTALALAPQILQIGPLFKELADGKPYAFAANCVNLQEGVIEKLISFPRRLAMHLHDPARNLDKTLVRHLYDIHQTTKAYPDLLSDTKPLQEILISKLAQDAREFSTQHPGFVSNPLGELRKAMEFARIDPMINSMYKNFIRDMVYGRNPPSFEESINSFNESLDMLLPTAGLDFTKAR
jgi:predicted nucleotidyltransferase component of viral defense system